MTAKLKWQLYDGEQAALCESFWPSSSGETKHCLINISVILLRLREHRFLKSESDLRSNDTTYAAVKISFRDLNP